LLKDSKSDDRVEVLDLTEHGRKYLNLRAESEQSKDDKGNGESESGAQEQNLNVHARLMEVCRHKVTGEGKDRMEVTKEISAVHVTVSATEEDTIVTSSGIGKNSDQYSERASDSSTVVGSSKGLNANLRRLYRSMNVPVPRPLPSLVQLMAASKRPRVSQTVQL
jgi:DNA cross-link repair 1A protein